MNSTNISKLSDTKYKLILNEDVKSFVVSGILVDLVHCNRRPMSYGVYLLSTRWHGRPSEHDAAVPARCSGQIWKHVRWGRLITVEERARKDR